MDDTQRIVKCGNLSLHTPGSFFKKRWHNKYLVLYDGSRSGVKRLELFESEIKFKKQSAVKIIPLVDCVRIVTCQRHKTTFTFEVRTSDQFYLLASKSFQDMNDWVNCLRFVAFGHAQATATATATPTGATGLTKAAPNSNGSQASSLNSPCMAAASAALTKRMTQPSSVASARTNQPIDVLLESRRHAASLCGQQVSALSNGGGGGGPAQRLASVAASQTTTEQPDDNRSLRAADQQRKQQHHQQTAPVMTASQAAAAAASALAKTRQRQPSLLGSCKPQPPNDSPFIKEPQTDPLGALSLMAPAAAAAAEAQTSIAGSQNSPNGAGHLDTLTPTVRGQLLETNKQAAAAAASECRPATSSHVERNQAQTSLNTLDEEEENMLYCSIEDNPSEHNYRVKVIETELALRCQLKCYQLTAPKTISQQYEELSQFRSGPPNQHRLAAIEAKDQLTPMVTFYQLIIGPQELTLLNDYAASHPAALKSKQRHQQGLWSWPYQCIRRYGFDKDNCFMFEAGRKCTSGPGQFIVQTPKAYNIYQDVVKFVNELRTINGAGNEPAAIGSICAPPTVSNSNSNSNSSFSPTVEQLATTVGPKQPTAVTQIPVTWDPNSSGALLGGQSLASACPREMGAPQSGQVKAESKRQFFDQLSRQVDASASKVPAASAANPAPAAAMVESNELASCPPIASDLQQQKIQAQSRQTVVSSDTKIADTKRDPSTSASHDQSATARLAPKQVNNNNATSSGPVSTAPNNAASQNVDRSHVTSSDRMSSGSDETDESGYEQGDESVGSGPPNRDPQARLDKKAPAEPKLTATRRLALRNDKLTVQADSSVCSSAGSLGSSLASSTSPCSSSTSSSAGNSPGQSVSRRTGETIQQEADRQTGGRLLANARASLNKVAAARQDLAHPHKAPQAKSTGALNKTALSANDDRQTIDFETSLIRDVYSEITKLHAKFAVTSTGSGGEDSMSSDSRESSVMVSSDRISNEDEDDEDDDDDEEDDEESNCADDGCYYMNEDSINDDQDEPMYSNLRPPEASSGQRASKRQAASLPSQQRSRSQQAISSLQRPQFLPADKTSNQHHRVQQQQPSHSIRTNPTNMLNYDPYSNPPLSPHSMRPIYPTILKPIPETSELVHNQPMRPDKSKLDKSSNAHCASRMIDQPDQENSTLDDRQNLSQRTRLPMDSAVVKRVQANTAPSGKKSDVSPQKIGRNKSKPTNHYVINDVQYAKISRNLAMPNLR